MSHSLSLTDGTTTVSLSSSGCTLLHYTPQSVTLRDYLSGKEAVTETIEVWIQGATIAAARATKESLERLLWAAAQRQARRAGTRVYLNMLLIGESDTYRAEVLDGVLLPDERSLIAWGQAIIPARLTISRRAYREGPEVEIPVKSNSQGTYATGGRAISNDSANWIEVNSGVITGDLPAPVRIKLSNSSGSGRAYSTFYIGHNAESDPANFSHHVEGESRDAGWGSTAASGSASGGSYFTYTVTQTSLTTIAKWTLSSSLVSKAAGRRFRLIGRFLPSFPTGVSVRPVVYDTEGLTVLWRGEEVRITGIELVDLGAFPLPPGGNISAASSIRLGLEARIESGSGALNLDYLQLLGLDSYGLLRQRGYTVANGDYLEADWIEKRAYTVSSAVQNPIVIPEYEIAVRPAVKQRIYVLNGLTTGDAPTSSNLTVSLFYRPRRLSL